MKKILVAAAGWLLVVTGAARAQAPAGAPAGATGICKDGTYSMQAKKDGACRGHKGVQTWYVASGAAPAPPAAAQPASAAGKPVAPVTTPARASVPRANPAPAVQANAPAQAATAASALPGKRLSPAQAAAQKPQQPGGGPGLVWVNSSTNVYHCNGDAYYGKTKAGKYMTEDQAKAAGARGDAGKSCAGK